MIMLLFVIVVKKIQNKELSYNDAQKQDDSKAQYWNPIPENIEDSSIEKANNKMYTYQNLGNK